MSHFIDHATSHTQIQIPGHPGSGGHAPSFFDRAMRVAPWLREVMAEPAPPEPELPNAEKYPTLAATGFIFAEAIDLGPVAKPACACPTCGRLTERVGALA